MVDEGQFREMTVDSVKSCHVCIVYVHSNPYFFFLYFVLFSLVLFISSVGFVAMDLCSQCDQLFRPTMPL